MKILKVKTAIAAVCVVAAGFGGVKAYNAANQSDTGFLLAENVEALSSGEGDESYPCWDKITTKPASYVVYCADCSLRDGTPTIDASLKSCLD